LSAKKSIISNWPKEQKEAIITALKVWFALSLAVLAQENNDSTGFIIDIYKAKTKKCHYATGKLKVITFYKQKIPSFEQK